MQAVRLFHYHFHGFCTNLSLTFFPFGDCIIWLLPLLRYATPTAPLLPPASSDEHQRWTDPHPLREDPGTVTTLSKSGITVCKLQAQDFQARNHTEEHQSSLQT